MVNKAEILSVTPEDEEPTEEIVLVGISDAPPVTFAAPTFVDKRVGPGFFAVLAKEKITTPVSILPNGVEISSDADTATLKKIKSLISAFDPTVNLDVNASVVSDTQFIQALAEDKYKIITWDEAMNWGAQGILPQILVTALDTIPDTATRNRAYMKARSAKSYIFSDTWVQSILQLLPQDIVAKMPGTDAQDKLQQLFNFAATL